MCKGVWSDGLLWGGHLWPSATQAVPVCVYLYNMCVWSDGRPEVVTCAAPPRELPTPCVRLHVCVNMCTVCVSDGCSEVVTYVDPSLCHQLVNRRPSAMESKRESLRMKKKACGSCQREVFTQRRDWHASERYKQCWRCKWKVTLWGFAPLSILIAGRNICLTFKEAYQKEWVFVPSQFSEIC